MIEGKRVVLGVTGSIAAYKACTVASHLTQMGALVDVVMTEAAQHFVTPLTFQALTGRPVYVNMWDAPAGESALGTHIAHVGLAHEADLLCIAPITAQSIAKLALGLTDDLLGVTALAFEGPTVIAPAMDAGMYENPATQEHVATLIERGVHLAGPATGRMASGYRGRGRLVPPEVIIGYCRMALGLHRGALRGRKVVVTGGPTIEPLDPVRYLTNHSSGRQGFAVAQAAVDAGADVTLIAGPVPLPTPVGAKRIDVTDARSMRDAVLTYAHEVDALIMAAAVGDFRPAQAADHKIKKAGGVPTLELAQNPDILREVAAMEERPAVVVGFAAESDDLIANAQKKLEKKSLDMIVANDITAQDAGFRAATNRVYFVTPEGTEALPLLMKEEVAARIVEWVAGHV